MSLSPRKGCVVVFEKERREDMTTGEMMFYGGIGGAGICLLVLIVCIAVFPGQRRKKLKKLSGE